MKRNRWNTPRTRGKSPYFLKRKQEHRYSELFRRWRNAVLDGRLDIARELSDAHKAQFLTS